jgi:hypothetical protein
MKSIPDDQSKEVINRLINGWVTWVNKQFQEANLKFDALGHSETNLNPFKPMHIFCEKLSKEINASFLPELPNDNIELLNWMNNSLVQSA